MFMQLFRFSVLGCVCVWWGFARGVSRERGVSRPAQARGTGGGGAGCSGLLGRVALVLIKAIECAVSS